MKKTAILILTLIATTVLAGDVVLIPITITTNTGPNCIGGNYVGVITYGKTISQGWGWAPDTNSGPPFTGTYTNTTHCNLQAIGKEHDTICSRSNSLNTANPPDTKYRWGVYFTNLADMPHNTNEAGLVLHNFLP